MRYAYKILQNDAVAQGNGTAVDCTNASDGGYDLLTLQIVGITTATVTFEATVDGATWVAVKFTNMTSDAAATTATADGLYRATVRGYRQVRARISAWTSGTIDITGILVA
jgi:hypothetical protein